MAAGVPAADAASPTPCPAAKSRQRANALFRQARIIRPGGSSSVATASNASARRNSTSGRYPDSHCGRAAELLHITVTALGEVIRRHSHEPQVGLTSAGAELPTRSRIILDEAAAKAALRRLAGGEAGTVRPGMPLDQPGPGWSRICAPITARFHFDATFG
jgi:hypothetical protein